MSQLKFLKSQLNAHTEAMLELLSNMPQLGNTTYTCQKMCLIAHLRDVEHAIDDINDDDLDGLKQAS